MTDTKIKIPIVFHNAINNFYRTGTILFLNVGIGKAVCDFLCPGYDVAILDTVVEVDTHKLSADTDADAVITGCAHSGVIGYERGRIVRPCTISGYGVIWHFGLSAVFDLILPTAELSEVSDRYDEIQSIINLYHALGGGYR